MARIYTNKNKEKNFHFHLFFLIRVNSCHSWLYLSFFSASLRLRGKKSCLENKKSWDINEGPDRAWIDPYLNSAMISGHRPRLRHSGFGHSSFIRGFGLRHFFVIRAFILGPKNLKFPTVIGQTTAETHG
jgi:hypothetical protein